MIAAENFSEGQNQFKFLNWSVKNKDIKRLWLCDAQWSWIYCNHYICTQDRNLQSVQSTDITSTGKANLGIAKPCTRVIRPNLHIHKR